VLTKTIVARDQIDNPLYQIIHVVSNRIVNPIGNNDSKDEDAGILTDVGFLTRGHWSFAITQKCEAMAPSRIHACGPRQEKKLQAPIRQVQVVIIDNPGGACHFFS
jgi:hypothetical protein